MFNKKNTMLMTVIAVATLIVAVVGATFAYFSINVSNESTKTTAVITTAKPGSVIIDGISNQAFYLKVSAEDMAETNKGYKYYALTTNNEESPSNNGKVGPEDTDSSYQHTIATAKLTEGDEGVTYKCNYTVTITSTPESLAKVETDDLILSIYDTTGNGTPIDLTELKTTGAKEISGTFTLNGPEENKDIKASLYLANRDAPQNYLAEQNISITISVAGGACEISNTVIEP